jgi:hypothetical protein
MKTLDMYGNSQDWLVEQGRVLQDLPSNDAADSHRDYWERQHNGVVHETAAWRLRLRAQ